jgi:hypothetical protein
MKWAEDPRRIAVLEAIARHDIEILASALLQGSGVLIALSPKPKDVICIGYSEVIDEPSNCNPVAFGKEIGVSVSDASVELAASNEERLFACKEGTSIAEAFAIRMAVVLSNCVRNAFDDGLKVNCELTQKLFIKLSDASLAQSYRYLLPWCVFVAGRDAKALFEKGIQSPTSESCLLSVLRPDVCCGFGKDQGFRLIKIF